MEKCRLCLTENSWFTDVTDLHQGTLLSLIIMTVCPIQIEPNDSLPQQVCEDCLEIVTSAYKLRNDSIKNDMNLRNMFDPLIKQEPMESDSKVVIHYQDATIQPKPKENDSPVLRYFGTLADATGNVIESQSDFVFCKICIRNAKLPKLPKSPCNSSLKIHLKTQHNIDAENNRKSQALETSQLNSKFNVLCAKTSNKITDQYFGLLVDRHGKEIASGSSYLFCKLCIESKRPAKRVLKSDSRAAFNMMFHLKLHHGVQLTKKSQSKISDIASTPRIEKKQEKRQVKIQCRKCPERFTSHGDFRLHWKSHVNTAQKNASAQRDGFICHVCSLEFDLERQLNKHMVLHEEKTVKCKFCPSMFYYKRQMEKHMVIHDANHHTKFQCDKCGKYFCRRKPLKYHMDKVHLQIPQEKKFQCIECNARFRLRENLKVHMVIHTGEVRTF